MKPRLHALAVLLGLAGCVHPQARLQCDEEPERDKPAQVQTIGDATAVANAEPIPVSGVGLVVGLEGTGAPAPPGSFRTMLEDHLRKKGYDNVKEILASPNHALVLVSALIQPGARKDDPLDVEITLPPQSKVTSLRGGVLMETFLFNYSSTHQVSPNTTRPDRLLPGHKLAVAEGPVLTGFGDGDEEARLRQGRLWGGGRCLIDRPFYLALNSEFARSSVAMRVADRINETFHGPYHGTLKGLAEAKTKEMVCLHVPPQYRHNLLRFLRVVRLIPLQEAPPPSSPYRRKLEEDLLNPNKTITAALRLEALGSDSISVLKHGLESDNALVRFASAEALAYLGSPACGEELAQLAVEEPMVRAYCLTALASLDEAICHVKLRELFAHPSPETRYGAFRALRALDERDSNVRGELLSESFWLHRVAPESPPLVHVCTSKRAEIVLFGDEVFLRPPFSFLAGPEFTVTAADGDERCTLSRFSLQHGASRRQCSLDLADILRTLAQLGGTYPDAVDLVRQAEINKCLSCPLAVDALPEAPSVHLLARAGKNKPPQAEDRTTTISSRSELGMTPTLFQKGKAPAPSVWQD